MNFSLTVAGFEEFELFELFELFLLLKKLQNDSDSVTRAMAKRDFILFGLSGKDGRARQAYTRDGPTTSIYFRVVSADVKQSSVL
jgi:hypothetical protein